MNDNVTPPPVQPRFREVPGDHPVMTLTASLEAPVGEARTLAGAAMLTAPGLRDVIAERLAQIERHGFTLEHDLGHSPEALLDAATSYIAVAYDLMGTGMPGWNKGQPRGWGHGAYANQPWGAWPFKDGWKPGADIRANLVKAVAIALAVIDRIDAAPQDAGAVELSGAPRLDAGRHDRGFPKGAA